MQLMNSPARYGALPQALHWLTAIFVIAGWLLGQFIDAFPEGAATYIRVADAYDARRVRHPVSDRAADLAFRQPAAAGRANPVRPAAGGRLPGEPLDALCAPCRGAGRWHRRGAQARPAATCPRSFGMSRRRGRPIGRRRGTRSGRTKFSPTRFSSLPVSMPPRRWCIITRFGIAPWCECCRADPDFQ